MLRLLLGQYDVAAERAHEEQRAAVAVGRLHRVIQGGSSLAALALLTLPVPIAAAIGLAVDHEGDVRADRAAEAAAIQLEAAGILQAEPDVALSQTAASPALRSFSTSA